MKCSPALVEEEAETEEGREGGWERGSFIREAARGIAVRGEEAEEEGHEGGREGGREGEEEASRLLSLLGYTLDFVIPPLVAGGREGGRAGERESLSIVLDVDGPFHFLSSGGGGGGGRGGRGKGERALGPTRLKHRVMRQLCKGGGEGGREGGRVWGGFVSISSREWEEAGKEGERGGVGEEEGRRRLVVRKLEDEGIDPRVYFECCRKEGGEKR